MMRVLGAFRGDIATLKHDYDMSGIMNPNAKPATHIFFRTESPLKYRDKGILVCHSAEDGMMPLASRQAVAKYRNDIDVIICCYPHTTRNRMPELRDLIELHQECPIHFDLKIKGGIVMITIMEKMK